MTLEEAIDAFKRRNLLLQKPKEADGQCYTTSQRFICSLISNHVQTQAIPRLIEYHAGTARYHSLQLKLYTRREWEKLSRKQRYLPGQCTMHTVVAVGRLRIDWTARQFDPKAPFPLIWETNS